MCFKEPCDVSARDASLLVAFICKVNSSLLLVGSVGNVPSPPQCSLTTFYDCHCSFTPRKETSWFLKPESWVCPCESSRNVVFPPATREKSLEPGLICHE